jgi:hypothetical protein
MARRRACTEAIAAIKARFDNNLAAAKRAICAENAAWSASIREAYRIRIDAAQA